MSDSSVTVLVTGGAGYIGSHTVLELLQADFKVVVIDNCANANMESVRRVEKMTGKKVNAYQVDLLDKEAVQEVFRKHPIYCVIHMAGLKAVGESCRKPFFYYKTNLLICLHLIEVMNDNHVYNLIFSSSSTVYGKPKSLPMSESMETGGCTNPYGWTKFFQERMLTDICHADKIPVRVVGRREGDIGHMVSDVSKASRELGWKADRSVQDMCDTLWNFQIKNPNGYKNDDSAVKAEKQTLTGNALFLLHSQ